MSLASGGKTKIEVNTTTVGNGDSIASYLADSAGAFITSTLVGAKQSVDVLAAGTFAEDSVHASGDMGMQVLGVRNDAGTALAADGDYIPLSMTSTGSLRVAVVGTVTVSGTVTTQYQYAEDSAHASGDIGAFTLAVRNDAGTPLAADGDYIPFTTDASGNLRVTFSGTVTTGDNKAEDAASASGDTGSFILGIRRDTTATQTSASGDYSELQTWSNGELKTVDIVNLSNLQQVISVGTTAVALPGTALTNRKSLMIQNLSSALVYVGSATVTSSGSTRGIQIGKGGFLTVDAGPAQAIFGIATSASSDVAIWELS
jgi:hypothetical protein